MIEEKINSIIRFVNEQQQTIEEQQQLIDRLFGRIEVIYRIFQVIDAEEGTFYHNFFWD